MPGIANAPFGAVMNPSGFGYLMPVVDPVQHQTTNAGGGPAGAFCREICNGLRDDELAIYVPVGYAGGGRLAADGVWNRENGGAAWARLVASVNYLRSIWPEGSSVAGAIFCQGETDRGANSAIAHTTAIREDFVYLRSLWGNFPVVVMPIGGNDWNVPGSNTYAMVNAHYKLDSNSGDPLALPLCKAVPRNPDWALMADNTHYVQDDAEKRGTIAGSEILKLNYGIAA